MADVSVVAWRARAAQRVAGTLRARRRARKAGGPQPAALRIPLFIHALASEMPPESAIFFRLFQIAIQDSSDGACGHRATPGPSEFFRAGDSTRA
jgi:hypothetical protein